MPAVNDRTGDDEGEMDSEEDDEYVADQIMCNPSINCMLTLGRLMDWVSWKRQALASEQMMLSRLVVKVAGLASVNVLFYIPLEYQ